MTAMNPENDPVFNVRTISSYKDGELQVAVITNYSPDALFGVKKACAEHSPISWREAVVDNTHHLLTAKGVTTYGHPVVMTVTSMSCGFDGTGVREAARVLSFLRFGDEGALYREICRPNTKVCEHDGQSRYEFARQPVRVAS